MLHLFMLHYFCVLPFPCCTFFILHNFHFAFFFALHYFYVLCYFMMHFYTLQYFRFALFSCCTLRMLHFFLLHFVHVALFPELQPGPPQTSTMKSVVNTLINKAVKYCCKALHLRCSWGSWLRLYCFHILLFLCSTLFILRSFNIKKYWKWTNTTTKTTVHSVPWTCFTFFDIL